MTNAHNTYTQNIEGIESIDRSKRAKIAPIVPFKNVQDINFSNIALQKAKISTIESVNDSSFQIENEKDIFKPKLPKTLTETSERKDLFSLFSSEEKAIGYEIAKAMQRNEKNIYDLIETIIQNIKYENDLIIELSKEDEKRLQAILEQIKKNENSETYKRILNVLSASLTIGIGSILLAPGTAAAITATATGAALFASVSPIWSYLMITSGISTILTGEIFPKVGLFDKIASFFSSSKEEEKNISSNIQMASSLTSTIIQVASSIAASPLSGYLFNWNNALKLFKTTLDLSSGGVNFLDSSNQAEYNDLLSKQTFTHGKLSTEQTNLTKEHYHLQNALDMQKAFENIAHKIFETLNKLSKSEK